MKPKIKVKKLHKDAKIPEIANEGDVGLDLYTTKGVEVYGHSRTLVPTGIALQFPDHLYAEIRERSGISVERPLSLKAGIIDSGYQGEIKIVVKNDENYPQKIRKGTKLAQLLVKERVEVDLEEVEEFDKESERGDKGFGSSDS